MTSTSFDQTPWRTDGFWAGTRAPLERSTGLDPRAYTDPAFFADEQDRLFGRAWVAVGLTDELPGPGHSHGPSPGPNPNPGRATEPARLLVRSVGGRSIIIVRDGDGTPRAYLNSCRHRGTELAQHDCALADHADGDTIRCPYHRWTYRLDGSLRSTPRFDEVPRDGFDPDEFGLLPLRVGTWGPLLLACLDPDTPPLTTWLGDLAHRMAGYDLDGWRLAEQQTVEIRANWKLISENYQEYYHLQWVHPELAKVSRVKDHYRYQGPGLYCGQTTTPVSGDDRDDWLVLPPAPGLDASDRVSGRFVALFPNVLLSVLPNHIFIMRLDPLAPGHTREHCAFLLPPGSEAGPDELGPTRTFWFDVNNEDIDIVQRSQRGLTAAAGSLRPGPLAPRFEEPLHRFHNMVADHLTLESMADLAIPAGDDGTEAARRGTGPNPHPPAVDRRTRPDHQTEGHET